MKLLKTILALLIYSISGLIILVGLAAISSNEKILGIIIILIGATPLFFYLRYKRKSKLRPNKDLPLISAEIIPELTLTDQTSISINKKDKYDFVVVDFETATDNMDSACSIGIVAVNGRQIVNREHHFICPPKNRFNSVNIKIHGITPDKVKDCPQFSKLWPSIKKYFETNLVIAHNAQFDMSVLYALLSNNSLPFPDFEYADSITIGRIGIDSSCRKDLESMALAHDVSCENHHSAIDDAETVAKMLTKLLEDEGFNSLKELMHNYRLSVKKFKDLRPNLKFIDKKGKRPSPSEIKSESSVFNHNHPCFNKRFVFTGELENFSRQDAMQKVVDSGGLVRTSISNKTDYLVTRLDDSDSPTTKLKKAEELISEGADIEIINEEEFIALFSSF